MNTAALTTEQTVEEAWLRIEAAHGNWQHIHAHPDDPINRDLLEGAVRLLYEAARYLEAV